MRTLRASSLAVVLACAVPLPVRAQAADRPAGETRRVSVTWERAPIGEVLRAFAAFSGYSIVAGADVTGFVTADINDRPWDVALGAILASQGLRAIEDASGIIRVETLGRANQDEGTALLVTRPYRLSFARAADLQATIAPLLSPRGGLAVLESTNTLVITDVERVHRAVAAALR